MLRSARRLDRGAKKGIAARPFPIFNDRNHFYPFIRGRRATNQRSASVAGTRGPFLTYKLISCPLKTALSRALLMKTFFCFIVWYKVCVVSVLDVKIGVKTRSFWMGKFEVIFTPILNFKLSAKCRTVVVFLFASFVRGIDSVKMYSMI